MHKPNYLNNSGFQKFRYSDTKYVPQYIGYSIAAGLLILYGYELCLSLPLLSLIQHCLLYNVFY